MARSPKQGGILGYPPEMYAEIEGWIEGVQNATRKEFLKSRVEELREDLEDEEDPEETRVLREQIRNLEKRVQEIKVPDGAEPGFQSREFDTNLKGWKYDDKSEAATKALPKIKVRFDPEPRHRRPGTWDEDTNTLDVSKVRFHDWRQTLKHELRHLSQTLLSKATGQDQRKKQDQGVQKSNPAPGMPSRHMMDRDVQQKYRDRNLPAAAREVQQRLKGMGIGDVELHALDDLEFYTRLADSVQEFQKRQREAKWDEPQTRQALGVFTGAVDPKKAAPAVRRVVDRPDETFEVWKKHNREKWKKGAKELVKASKHEAARRDNESSTQALWERFLREKYEGGKAKVQNPNPQTRSSHPEVTVNYLMRKPGRVYDQARQGVRREFLQWRREQR
jgi:hypothetical protein